MATIFVSAVDGNNADSGATWALAKQTVAGALAIAAVGDTIWVDNAGTFTAGAAITWTLPAGGIAIISAARSGTITASPAAGAIEAVGAANAAFTITQVTGSALYCYGMTIKGGTNNNSACTIALATASATSQVYFVGCTLEIPSAQASTQIVFGGFNAASYIQIRDSTALFSGSRAGTIFGIANADVEIIGLTVSTTGGTKPATLFASNSSSLNAAGNILLRDSDISGFATSSGALVNVAANNFKITILNSKISATPTITTGSWNSQAKGSITLRNVDSGDTTYVFSFYDPRGTLTVDTSNYKDSGFTFGSGAIPASWKVVTTAICSSFSPFRLPPLFIWNTTTSSQTSAIEFAQNSAATALTDQEIWSDIDFAASASFPNYTNQTNRNAAPITGTPANQPSSSATWTGLTSETAQKLTNTFTAAEVGLLQSVISIGKASTTVYINPRIDGVS